LNEVGNTSIFTHAGIGGVSKSVSLGDVDGDGDLDAWVDNEGQASGFGSTRAPRSEVTAAPAAALSTVYISKTENRGRSSFYNSLKNG